MLVQKRYALILLVWAGALYSAPPDGESIRLFETKIRPVLAARCYVCHSAKAAKPQGGLLLDSQAGLKNGGNSGPVLEPGNPDGSLLVRAIRYRDKELRMPPGKALPDEAVADIEAWIRAGAVMPSEEKPETRTRETITFLPPKDYPPPAVKLTNWPRNPIDHFILAKLEEKGLSPSPQASRRDLIRRLSFDLTGLPPTAEEIEAFAADPAPDAYAKLVDSMLASPRYGERWGRFWLDVARYSDARNVGDRFPYSYTYRDWVIRAFNEDLPYDQFVVQQLAADRLPNNDRRNLAALGFLSLGREFPKSFPETVDDRIDTVTRGLLGLTVACARCHDHKYDPIPTKDYYSFYSIFSNVREPEDLPELVPGSPGSARAEVYEQRLRKIRQTDAEYRRARSAEMNAFFRTQIAEYLLAVRDSARMSNTEIEEMVRERQLNLHVLARWRKYLANAAGDPVFRLWLSAAAIPDSGFAAGWPAAFAAASGSNPLVLAEFRAGPPESIRDLAARYAAMLTRSDGPARRAIPQEEQLRLALRGPASPVNVPVAEFDLIYTEGDGNNTRGFRSRYDAMRALYAYDGGAPRAMAVEDVPNPKPAHVFIRGNPNNPGVETPAHFLTCLTSGEPATFRDGSGRLDLARAIASRDNPLTARVMVNRVWMQHFGAGLVRTPSDFGVRGDPPTHPELLDYLAVRFMESGWSVKKLHRLILLSATYRQSSADRPDARAADTENQLLWRMNRRRRDIESLRDSILAASGQLDLTAGGPPFAITAAPAVPRRTVYAYIERGRIPGMLSAFDFASPDQHVPVRFSTTVPQQALFLLNSGFMAEQAAHLAARPEVVAETDPARRIARLYRAVFGREPASNELALGLRFVQAADMPAPEPENPAWQYGLGSGASFIPFRYFTGDSWQAASMLPDPTLGKARLRATGGEPGDAPDQPVIRRWVAPAGGKISIEGALRHNQSAVPAGDGVRARIVSSRSGELASWTVNGTAAETRLSGITVERGDTIDFLVDGRDDSENDAFLWAPSIKLQGSKDAGWNAAADFRGPAPTPLNAWERYAQVLLETNEFAFVD